MNHFVKPALLLTLAVYASCCVDVCAADGFEKTNIIWIVADDLGYNELSCMGQKNFQTPRIDAMAKNGMKFTQFYAGSTVCAPSRACFLTGQHTGHVYQRFNGKVAFRENPLDYTIASMLQTAGYKTAMIGKSGLSCNDDDGALPNRKGFDHFFGFTSHGDAHRYYPKKMFRNGEVVVYENNNYKEGTDYSGDEFIRESLQWIEQQKDQPFFLHMSLQQPHADLQVPDKYRQPFIGKFDETPSTGGHYRAETHPKATVAAMITYLDESIGKVVDKVEQLGLSEKTVIMVTSDNGPHSEGGHHPEALDSNGPLRGGKRDFYEGGIRVPLIAYWPGKIAAGTTSDLICASWDFPATACELVGIEPPKATDGVSLVPTLTGAGEQRLHGHLYWEFYEFGGKQAVRAGNWKAIRLDVGKNPNGPLELYDLATDIGEQNNVASQHPEIVKRMAKIMNEEHTESEIISFETGSPKVVAGKRIADGSVADRSSWKVVSVDSESSFNGKVVTNLFDGKSDTFWHTKWNGGRDPYPHQFVVDMNEAKTISGIRIYNRQDGNDNGFVKEFELYVSDSAKFEKPVLTGAFKASADEQSVSLPAGVKGRYFKFVALSDHKQQAYASISEFNIETSE